MMETLDGSDIAAEVKMAELIVGLSEASSFPRKDNFLSRMRQDMDLKFRHSHITLPEVFFCNLRILRPISF